MNQYPDRDCSGVDVDLRFRVHLALQTWMKAEQERRAFRSHPKRRRWVSSGSAGVTASGKAGLVLIRAIGFEQILNVSSFSLHIFLNIVVLIMASFLHPMIPQNSII